MPDGYVPPSASLDPDAVDERIVGTERAGQRGQQMLAGAVIPPTADGPPAPPEWIGPDRTYKLRPGDQPLPVHNDSEDIQSQVIRDIEARRELGVQRYGTALQPHNGRDALRDAYEEAIDLAMYLKQAMVERNEDAPGSGPGATETAERPAVHTRVTPRRSGDALGGRGEARP